MRWIVLACLVYFSRSAHAAWPADPNVNVRLAASLCSAQNTNIIGDGVGGALVAWEDCRSGPTDVYVQHVRADGTVDPGWPEDGRGVAVYGGYQTNPVLLPDGYGGAILFWDDSRDFSMSSVYAQHVLNNGSIDPAWPFQGLLVSATGSGFAPRFPSVVSDGAGGVLVAFAELINSSWEMSVHRVLANGTLDPAWGVLIGKASTPETGVGPKAKTVSDGLGGVIVAWPDERGATGTDIYATRVRAIGLLDPSWPAGGLPVCTAPGNSGDVAIDSDGAGGAILAWSDSRGGGDLYAARIGAGGNAQWPINGNLVCGAPGYQYTPRIAADGTGGAIISWRDERVIDEPDIYAQRVMPHGAMAWAVNGIAVCLFAGYQVDLTMRPDGTGGATIAWRNSSGPNMAIYAQRILSNGSFDYAWPLNGRPVCTAAGSRISLASASDGSGGVILAWSDNRGGMYAQRVDSYGLLGPAPVGVVGTEPPRLRLLGCQPNPSTGRSNLVRFELVDSGPVVLEVFDVGGRRRFAHTSLRDPGTHSLGLPNLPAGVYMVRLQQNGESRTGRMVILD